MAIVYKHTGLDNGEIFYIGIGKSVDRATCTNKRSTYWHSYVNKHSYVAEILFDDITWEEACLKEMELINFYGRRDRNSGTLINMTDGGAGGDTMSGRKNPSLSARNSAKKGMPGLKLVWLSKDGKNTRALEENIQSYLDDGWIRGMIALKPESNRNKKGHIPWNKGKSGYKNSKIGDALKGTSRPQYKRGNLICPHCKKEGDATALKRWHFDNCKNKTETK